MLFTSSNLTGSDDVTFFVNYASSDCKVVTARPAVSGNSLAAVFSVEDSDDGECGKNKSSSSFPWWAGLIVGLGVLCCMLLVCALALGFWLHRYIAKKRHATYRGPKQTRHFSSLSRSRQSNSAVQMTATPAQRAAELSAAAEVLGGQ